jgi:hypothetical protein
MARSIVLRFDATCFDCGAPLSAGTTARWFGRGRVSCCGADNRQPEPRAPRADAIEADGATADATVASLLAAAPLALPGLVDNIVDERPFSHCKRILAILASRHNGSPAHVDFALRLTGEHVPTTAAAPQPAADALRELQTGLSPTSLAMLASREPSRRLCVRLQSGARFLVTAVHAAHVIRCVEESCVDRVRDVMGAAQ